MPDTLPLTIFEQWHVLISEPVLSPRIMIAAEHEEKPERKAALKLLALSYKHATERGA
jgi:hypothetical protein